MFEWLEQGKVRKSEVWGTLKYSEGWLVRSAHEEGIG